jgi:hypothetical protein
LVAASLKVDDATKAALDRLQATLTLATGRKPALQDLLALLTQMGWEQRSALAQRLGDWTPLDADDTAALLASWEGPAPEEAHRPGRDDRDLHEERA